MLAAGLPVELVPLDVTRRVVLAQAALSTAPAALRAVRAASSSRISPLHGFAFGGMRGDGGITLHDPLAMAVALDPSLVGFEPLHVEVECEGRISPAGCRWRDRRELRRAPRTAGPQLPCRPRGGRAPRPSP